MQDFNYKSHIEFAKTEKASLITTIKKTMYVVQSQQSHDLFLIVLTIAVLSYIYSCNDSKNMFSLN